MWRSLVAHYTGGVVVVGSNPAIPTNAIKLINYDSNFIRGFKE